MVQAARHEKILLSCSVYNIKNKFLEDSINNIHFNIENICKNFGQSIFAFKYSIVQINSH